MFVITRMPLDAGSVQSQATALQNLVLTSDFQTQFNKYGSSEDIKKEIASLKKNTDTLNREFDERYLSMGGTYKIPFFGTNQDILLIGFYLAYAFFSTVMLITYYKATLSWQNTLYGAMGCVFALLILTGILFRIA